MIMFNRNEATKSVISGYRVGTHIKYEGITKKEYYVKTFALRSFGKNPKILKTEEKAKEFMAKVLEKTGNTDLFIDPIYATTFAREIVESPRSEGHRC